MSETQERLNEQVYNITNEQLDALTQLVYRGGDAVMNVYRSDSFETEIKVDKTPLTRADRESDAILTEGLPTIFPNIPVVSEEGDDEASIEIVKGDSFWLVDPLDGTKEFVEMTGEFAVGLALVINGKAVFGMVFAPALDGGKGVLYYGGPGMGAFKVEHGKEPQRLHVSAEPTGIIMGSKSNREKATDDYIAAHYPEHEIKSIGSMLKMMLIAEGRADAFPRIDGPLHTWDLAPQAAILEGAGGIVARPDGSPIDYRDHYHNGKPLRAGDFVGRSF